MASCQMGKPSIRGKERPSWASVKTPGESAEENPKETEKAAHTRRLVGSLWQTRYPELGYVCTLGKALKLECLGES
jgi:hypothetical protein